MKLVARLERTLLVTGLAGAVGLAGAALAQYPQDQKKPTITPPPSSSITPPLANDPAGAKADKPAASASGSSTKELMATRPIIPSKAELPDAAFKKLDATGKGYVTADDTKDLAGFDKAFQMADANHDGKLDAAEFKRAWASFTGRSSG